MPQATFGSSFSEAEAYFRRKLSIPTERWDDLWRGMHAHAVMFAGANQMQLVEDLRTTVEARIAGGGNLETFRAEFAQIVAKHGWSYNGSFGWRTRVIYETNLRQAYNAGRWQQLTDPDMRLLRPFLEYRHNDKGTSLNPRPMHLSWNGTVLPVDHPWWRTHAPMNGWGCKCGLRSLTLREVQRRGLDPAALQAPNDGTYQWVSASGTTHTIPRGIDPGFDYAPGVEAANIQSARALGERIMSLPPAARAAALNDLPQRIGFVDDAASWLETIFKAATSDGSSRAIGMQAAPVVDWLVAAGRAPKSALVVAEAQRVAHLGREAKDHPLDPETVARLADLLLRYDAVLEHKIKRNLLYARRRPDGRYDVLVVNPAYTPEAGALKGLEIGAVLSGAHYAGRDLSNRAVYDVIYGQVVP